MLLSVWSYLLQTKWDSLIKIRICTIVHLPLAYGKFTFITSLILDIKMNLCRHSCQLSGSELWLQYNRLAQYCLCNGTGLMRVISTPTVVQHSVSPIFSTSPSTAQQSSCSVPLLPGPDCWTTISSQLFPPLPPHSTPWWNESAFPIFDAHTVHPPQSTELLLQELDREIAWIKPYKSDKI